MSVTSKLFRDPLKYNAWLILLAFGSMFILPSQSTSAIFTYLLGVLMLFQFSRWRQYLKDPLVLLSGVLLGYLWLSSFWSEPVVLDKARSILVRALSTFLFLIGFIECWQAGYLQRYLGRVVVVTGAAAAALAVGFFLITAPEDGRLNGLGQLGAHVIAGLMFGVVLILLLQSLRGSDSAGWRAIAAAAALCLIVALALTFSRNAWFSSLAGLMVFAAATLSGNRIRFLITMVAMLVIAVLLGSMLLSSDTGREWLLPRGDSFRPLIWTTIFERVWTDGPVFGLGILTPDDVVNGDVVHPHPHSMYLAVLYQGGIVGLGLFLSLIVMVLRELWRHFDNPVAASVLGVLTVGLLSYLFDGHELVDRIGETWMLFWLPVAVTASLRWQQQGRTQPGCP